MERDMGYSEADLSTADAAIRDAERRQEWMSGVVTTLKANNLQSRAAERQLARFAEMSAAMRNRRREIEDAIVASRGGDLSA
jgi:hypothetical protein